MFLLFSLQVGFDLEVNGRMVHFTGAMHMAIGDTPAAACLGGFKEGVGFSRMKCRQCDCIDEQMQTHFKESKSVMYKVNCHNFLVYKKQMYWKCYLLQYKFSRC